MGDRRWRLMAGAAVPVLALSAAACGGDGEGSSPYRIYQTVEELAAASQEAGLEL